MNDIRIGDDVKVVSGPHEGRGGRVVHLCDVSVDQKEHEPYALVEFQERDCFNDLHTDQISVPARRLARY